MITDIELKKAFDKAVKSFLYDEIKRQSLADKIGTVEEFDDGDILIIERKNEPPIKIETKEYTSKSLIEDKYSLTSDFDMIRALFQNMADKLVNQQNTAIVEELEKHAGMNVDAKGDILGGVIEALEQMNAKGIFSPISIIKGIQDPIIESRYFPDMINGSKGIIEKLDKAIEDDSKKAEILKSLLSKG